MSHDTVQRRLPKTQRDVRRALKRLGISQRELARRIGKEPSLVSRVVRGAVTSAVIWSRIHAFLADPEHYTPPPKEGAAA